MEKVISTVSCSILDNLNWKKCFRYVSGVTRKQTYVDSDDLTELILNFRKKSSDITFSCDNKTIVNVGISDQPLYPDISSPSKSPIESVTPPSPTPPPLRCCLFIRNTGIHYFFILLCDNCSDSPPPPIPSIPSTTSTSSVPIVPSISDAKVFIFFYFSKKKGSYIAAVSIKRRRNSIRTVPSSFIFFLSNFLYCISHK